MPESGSTPPLSMVAGEDVDLVAFKRWWESSVRKFLNPGAEGVVVNQESKYRLATSWWLTCIDHALRAALGGGSSSSLRGPPPSPRNPRRQFRRFRPLGRQVYPRLAGVMRSGACSCRSTSAASAGQACIS